MGAWDVLLEVTGDDDDDDTVAGQIVPAPREPFWNGSGPRPVGSHTVHRRIVLPDGRQGMAWNVRPGGLYDVTVGGEDLVLHSSEFDFR